VSHRESASRGVPLTDDERAGLRHGIDADALSQLFRLIEPDMRQLTLSLVQRKPPPPAQLVEAARRVLGDAAAGQLAAHGPKALWIEFPDAEQNRLWHRALGLPAG
jgi:hypothetical protein